MNLSRVIAMAGLVAVSFGVVACGDDSSSPSASTPVERISPADSSSSGSDSSDSKNSECAVKDGVIVVKPAGGESFKMGDTITVVYGSSVAGSGYRFLFKTSADDAGMDMLEESAGPQTPDGVSCYEQKVVLSSDYAEPSDEAIIRVVPYEKTSKGANSGVFKVTE